MKTLLSLLLCIPLALPVKADEKIATTHFKKVVWIVFENVNYAKALAQPDFQKIAQNGVLFTNFTAEVHPSQGNYIAMIAGSNFGIANDNNVDLNQTHVGDLLEKAGLNWKVYAEDYPGNCFTGKSSGYYVRKHVPFISFTSVTQNSARCLNVEDEKRFDDDMAKGLLPEFSMYIPNIKNDGHDTGVDFAGKWISKKFGSRLSNPSALGDVLFIITFDESGPLSPNNQIYTVLIGANVAAGTKNTQAVRHPALLKMIEDEYKIGNLGREDAQAPSLSGVWK